MDTRCVRILRLFVALHEAHGKDAVIHAIEQQGGGPGWFVVRGVIDPATGREKRYGVDWPEPRRRTENMAHMGLFDWVNKSRRSTSGFRLNENGYDFVNGRATVRRTNVFRAGWIGIVKRKGPRIAITDIKDTQSDRESAGMDRD
jgi:hypothetical protein